MIAREKEPFRDRREPVPPGDALAFPGGGVESGEGAIDAARRELFEETGFRAIGDPFTRIVVEFTRGATNVHIDSFAFLEWTAPTSRAELEPKWMTFGDALASRLAPGMQRALTEFQCAFEALKKSGD